MVKVAKLRDCCSISDYRLQQQKVEELKLRYEQVTFITAFLLQRIYYNDVFDWLSCSILVPFVFHSCSIRALCVLHSCSMRAPCVLHSCSMRAPFVLHACSMRAPFVLHFAMENRDFKRPIRTKRINQQRKGLLGGWNEYKSEE